MPDKSIMGYIPRTAWSATPEIGLSADRRDSARSKTDQGADLLALSWSPGRIGLGGFGLRDWKLGPHNQGLARSDHQVFT
jgi:hypothetical protein